MTVVKIAVVRKACLFCPPRSSCDDHRPWLVIFVQSNLVPQQHLLPRDTRQNSCHQEYHVYSVCLELSFDGHRLRQHPLPRQSWQNRCHQEYHVYSVRLESMSCDGLTSTHSRVWAVRHHVRSRGEPQPVHESMHMSRWKSWLTVSVIRQVRGTVSSAMK